MLLALSTRQVSDVVELDEEILRPKVKRLCNDGHLPASDDPSDRLETVRHVCATCYLELLQRLSGLLTHSSQLSLIKEPIPLWNIVRMINPCDRADAVYQQIRRLDKDTTTWLQMPCAQMPLSED